MINKVFFKLLVVWSILCIDYSIAFAQDIELGNEYFQKGEYEKAVQYFQKSAKDNTTAQVIHSNYLTALYKLKYWEEAEKFLKKQMKANPTQLTYKAEYIDFLKKTANEGEATKQKEELFKEAVTNDAYVYMLYNHYYNNNEFRAIVELLEMAKARDKDNDKFAIQLARAYLYVGDKEKMLEEVMQYGLRNSNEQYVKATIQDNFAEEKEIELLEKILYTKIQQFPNEPYYTELLIWHFIQQKDFRKAFIQSRAIDRRLKLEGQKVFEIANIAYNNKDFRNAANMYEYIINEYPAGEYYPFARRMLIQTKEELVKTSYPVNKEDINSLIREYEQMFIEVGKNPKTLDALRNVALLQAFYLDNHDQAISVLQNAINEAGGNQLFKDQCKLDMGDIYILKNEPWEAALLYMQVEKTQKEDKLGELAKLKNAKNHYFNGEFELAKEILDILKKATTREIANDAMQLSLLIQDNTGMDTSEVAMQKYAAVELLIFQNKLQEAVSELSTLYKEFNSHSLADEILWLRASTNLKLNNSSEALADIENILKNYNFDIMADDALFLKAKLYEENIKDKTQAMSLYRQLLQQYPGSIYGVEARKRYRTLRGDYIN